MESFPYCNAGILDELKVKEMGVSHCPFLLVDKKAQKITYSVICLICIKCNSTHLRSSSEHFYFGISLLFFFCHNYVRRIVKVKNAALSYHYKRYKSQNFKNQSISNSVQLSLTQLSILLISIFLLLFFSFRNLCRTQVVFSFLFLASL